jgi:RecB family endonuclease NucS
MNPILKKRIRELSDALAEAKKTRPDKVEEIRIRIMECYHISKMLTKAS